MVCCDTISIAGLLLSLYVLYKIVDRLLRIPRIGRYGDHYVLVTGCGHGMGLEAVRRLEKLGCHVFAGCRKQESVEELKKTFSDRVHPILMDVSNLDSVRKAFEYVSSQLPEDTGLWGLVNNAAIADVLPMELIDTAMYRRVMDTNLLGTIDVTMTFLPLVKKARGRILNISSLRGRITSPRVVPYAISKYGMEAFTDGLRRSLRPFGCKALLIEPGGVNTNIVSPKRIVEVFEAAFRKINSTDQTMQLTEEGERVLKQESEKFLKTFVNSATYSTPIDVAIDQYEHALFGVYPRARYIVGMDAKIEILFVQRLPEWLSDWIMCSRMPDVQCRTTSDI